LIVAPHVSIFGREFDLASYQRRGWTRLEQWARLSQRGTEEMYLCDGDAARPAKDVSADVEMLKQAMEYMDGEFTMRENRVYLVDTSVALYYMMKKKFHAGTLNDTAKQLLLMAQDKRDEIFPINLFDNLMQIVEEEVDHGSATFYKKSILQQATRSRKQERRTSRASVVARSMLTRIINDSHQEFSLRCTRKGSLQHQGTRRALDDADLPPASALIV
jgi:hypothetical protein